MRKLFLHGGCDPDVRPIAFSFEPYARVFFRPLIDQVSKGLFVSLLIFCLLSLPMAAVAAVNQKGSVPFSDLAALPIKYYSLEQGLSQSVVYDVVQDQLGYLWVATGRGLNRFDGHEFRTFLKDPDTPEALQQDYIHRLLVDQQGGLWVGTLGGGLAKYEPKKESLTRITLGAKVSDLEIYDLAKDSANNIWVVTERDLYRISADRSQIVNFKSSFPNLRGAPRTVAVGHDGYLYIASNAGELMRLSTEAKVGDVMEMLVDDLELGLINHVSWFGDQKLLVTSSLQGLYELDLNRTVFPSKLARQAQQPALLNKLAEIYSISDAHVDRLNCIWIATDGNGLYLYDPATDLLVNLRSERGGAASLKSDRLLSVYRDNSDTLWVGTFASGLNSISLESSAFQRIGDNADQKIHLSDRVVWAVHNDEGGGLLVGTDTGVDYRAPEQKRFAPLSILDSSKRNLLQSGATSFIEEGQTLWIGTWAEGLIKYNLQTKLAQQFNRLSALPSRLVSDRVRVLLNSADGKLWVGTEHGLNILDKATGEVVAFQHDAKNLHSLPHNRIRSLYQERHSGRVWIGTSAGLVFYDPGLNGFRPPELEEPWNSELPKLDIRAIYKDDQNVFWLGTGNGLLKISLDKGTAKHFLQKNGLPNNVLYSFLPDENNNYWIATDNGLSMFDSESEAFTNYFVRDGLQSNELNFGAYTKDSEGNLYFGGTEGLTIFNPLELVPEDLVSAPLVVNDVKAYSASYNLRKQYVGGFSAGDPEPKPLMFDIDDKRIEISFVGIDFNNPYHLSYAYQLGNQDQDWKRVDSNNRIAVYTNLSPGSHVFKLGFSSAASDKVTDIISIPIYMQPAFWQTLWFRLLIVAGLIGLVALLINARVSNLRARAQQLKHEVELKTQALKKSYEARSKDLMIVSHNLGSPIAVINQMTGTVRNRLDQLGVLNSDISGQLDLLKEGINQADERVRQLGEVVKLQRWELKENQLVQIRPKLQATLSAFTKDLERIQVHEILEAVVFCPSDAPSIILDNLLSNALKYSPAKSLISLRFNKTDAYYCIECADLGDGIPKGDRELVKTFEFRHELHSFQATGQGVGLSLVNEMLIACGGYLDIDDNLPRGSIMKACIPLV